MLFSTPDWVTKPTFHNDPPRRAGAQHIETITLLRFPRLNHGTDPCWRFSNVIFVKKGLDPE